MLRLIVTVAVLLAFSGGPLLRAQGAAAVPSSAHNRQYFRDIASHSFAVPPGASAFVLAQELTPWLASPDPELRDIWNAYEISSPLLTNACTIESPGGTFRYESLTLPLPGSMLGIVVHVPDAASRQHILTATNIR